MSLLAQLIVVAALGFSLGLTLAMAYYRGELFGGSRLKSAPNLTPSRGRSRWKRRVREGWRLLGLAAGGLAIAATVLAIVQLLLSAMQLVVR